jgi:hypothetical protein
MNPVGGLRHYFHEHFFAHVHVRHLGCGARFETGPHEGAPLMFEFRDPDGNRFYVTQVE